MREGIADRLARLALQLRRVAVKRARRHQQLRLQRGQQVHGERLGRHVQCDGQVVETEARAQQRGHAQRLARRVGQALELLQHQRDDVVRRARRRDPFKRVVPALRGRVVMDQAAADQVLQQPSQEEGIARRARLAEPSQLVQAVVLGLGVAMQAIGDQVARVIEPQRAHAQRREALAQLLAQLGQLLRDRMPGRNLVVAIGEHEQRVPQRRVVQAFAQQPARRAIGPLPVIEEQRLRLALARERREALADAAQEAVLCLSRSDGHQRRVERQERRHLWQRLRQQRGIRAQALAQPLAPWGLQGHRQRQHQRRTLLQQMQQWPIGAVLAVLVELRRREVPPLGEQAALRREHQRRLADAGEAGDGH